MLHLKYDLSWKAGVFKPDEIQAEGSGGTDRLIVISCIEHENGSYSQVFYGVDGFTDEPPSAKHCFKAWNMMGAQVAEMEGLEDWQKETIEKSIQAVRDALGIKKLS